MSDTDNRDPLAEYDESELIFHPDGRVTRKRFLLAAGGTAFGAAAGPLIFSGVAEAQFNPAGVHLPYKAHTDVKGHLEFWHFWSSPLRRGAIHAAISNFQKTYKNIHVSDLPVPFGNIFDKLAASVAAQSGVPDVVVANRPNFVFDAKNNLYQSLNAYQLKDRVNANNFLSYTWQQCNVKKGGKNQLYGLPFETDIRVIYINRAQLVDAGLSPNTVPKTWSEMKQLADKLDQKSGSNYKTLTFWPVQSGPDLSAWAWTNKGEFENAKHYPTLTSAPVVQSGDWMQFWAKRYGDKAWDLLGTQVTPGLDPFASGLVTFYSDQPTYQDFTLNAHGVQFHPKNGKDANLYPYWNVSPVPVNNGGKPYSFSGGFAIGVPRNKHRSSANSAAAWEFVKYMSLAGQLTFERAAGNMPAVKSMWKDPALKQKLHWDQFIAALRYGHPGDSNPYDPLYPGDVLLSGQPDAQSLIMTGTPPKEALAKAQSQALQNMKRLGGP